MISPGLTIILIYFLLTYILQFVANGLVDLSYVSPYRIYPNSHLAITFVVCFSALLWFLDKPFQHPSPYFFRKLPIKYSAGRFWLSLALAAVSVAGFVGGYSRFRYAPTSAFADQFSLAYLLVLVPIFLKADFLYNAFFINDRSTTNANVDRATSLALMVAAVFSINGISSAFFAMVYVCYLLFGSRFVGAIDHRKQKTGGHGRRVALVATLVCTVILGWSVGEIIKVDGSLESLLEQSTNPDFFRQKFLWVLVRPSSTYYSLLMTINDFFLNLDLDQFENFLIPLKTFLFRLNVVLGKPFVIDRPMISSLDELNEHFLGIIVTPRSSASPGLISTFFLSFPFPFNLIFLFAYAILLTRLFNRLYQNMVIRPNFFGHLLFCWIVLFFFESPFAFFTVIGEFNINLGLVLWILFKTSKTGGFLRRRPIPA